MALGHVKNWLSQRVNSVVELLYPPFCLHCRSTIEQPIDAIQFCLACRTSFIDTRPACLSCGAWSAGEGKVTAPCFHCRDSTFKFSSVVRLGDYAGELRLAILAAKQDRDASLALQLGNLLGSVRYEELAALKCDAVVAVPVYWSRRLKHGYNSADVLAEQVAARLRLPLVTSLLLRKRPTEPQSTLSPSRRRANVHQAFLARNHPDFKGARLLLIDDLLTTGSTANDITRALIQVGVSDVAVAILARAAGENH